MTGFLAAVASGAALLALLAGCAAHLLSPSALPGALRAHRVLPARAVPVAALAVLSAEGLLGLGGGVALLTGSGTALAAVLGASAVLFGGYAAYAWHVLASGRGGPCGCARTELPMSGWIAGRALAFSLLALTGALLSGPGGVAPLPQDPAPLATALLATLTFAALLWTLPAAMHEPAAGHQPFGREPFRGGRPQWTS